MLTGIIIGIIIMSVCAMLGIVLLDADNLIGWLLLGPASWVLVIAVLLHEFYLKLISGRTLLKYNFEQLKRTNTYYKHLFGNYHMMRYQSNKNKHPILYHLIIIEKIKVK